MLPRKLKLNKLSIVLFFIIGLIFIQALLLAPQDLNESETLLGQKPTTKSQLQKLASAQNNRKAIEQKMTGVFYVENSNNSKGWQLHADEATGSSEDQLVVKKVKVEFFTDNISSFIVTGDIGEVDGQTKNMVIRGQVITQSSNGYQFITNDLHYFSKEKKLKSDSQVTMLGPQDKNGAGFNLLGEGFVIDIVTNKMYILSNIEAEKEVNKKKFTVNSRTAQFSNKNQEALFQGDVIMRFEKTKVTAPNAFFKYSDKQKSLDSITLKDKVLLTDEGKLATCKELVMNILEDTMVLRGQPKVQMGDDEIQGEEIIFLEGGKKVKINKVKVKGTKEIK